MVVLPVTVTVSVFTTLTVATTAGPEHPWALVPVRVYIVVTAGVTVIVLPVMVYVLAPEGVKVNELPGQIAPLLIESVGSWLTVRSKDPVDTQPLSVPVAVYTVFTEGDTAMVAVVAVVFHENEVAPLAVTVAVEPLQIGPVEVRFTVGVVITVTVDTKVFEETQPTLLVPVME
jgi:hypothetical protein